MEFNKQNILNKVKAATQTTVVMDEGLRAYMLKVYNYMATGILLTGIISLISFKLAAVIDPSGAIAFTSFGNTIFFSGWKWVNIEELEKLIVPFKKEMYKKIVKEFLPLVKKI